MKPNVMNIEDGLFRWRLGSQWWLCTSRLIQTRKSFCLNYIC